MGWSCTALVGDVLDRWKKMCLRMTESSNTYEWDGKRYFIEVDDKEYADGHIEGDVWQMVNARESTRQGSFRIDADGTVSKPPYGLLVGYTQFLERVGEKTSKDALFEKLGKPR